MKGYYLPKTLHCELELCFQTPVPTNFSQVCFKDLVTVSYDNSLALVQKAKGRHWIGLREYYKGINN